MLADFLPEHPFRTAYHDKVIGTLKDPSYNSTTNYLKHGVLWEGQGNSQGKPGLGEKKTELKLDCWA